MTKSKTSTSKTSSAKIPPTYVARLRTGESEARRLADLLSESLDPTDFACAAFAGPDGRWQVDLHFRDKPDEPMLRELVAHAGGKALARALKIERIAPRDWVKKSLVGLVPVRAGRFVVHGAHDRVRVPPHSVAIEIEAATAFGTGHHGTTRGCLLALDWLARQPRRPRHVLDLGTGTGVLAIAAAKTLRVPVLGVDVDVNSVKVARANAALNGAGAFVTAVHGRGFNAPEAVRRAPFDLVLCNILLGPLQRLAAPMARSLMPGAHVVLSGILSSQANAAISAYRSQGLVLERSFRLDGWTTLLLHAPRA